MKTYTDVGFVIKQKQFKEADKFYVIMGQKFGRIEAVAKSAGKPLSRKGGSLDLLNLCKFSFTKTRSLDLMLEVELIDDFKELKSNLEQISEIFYFLEILDKFLIVSENEQSFFNTFHFFIKKAKFENTNTSLLYSIFELKLMQWAGFMPVLDKCLFCRIDDKPGKKRIAASGGEAGYFCDKHFEIDLNFEKLVDDSILKIQKYIFKHELNQCLKIKADKNIIKRLRSIHKTWLEGILENRLKSTGFKDLISSNH